MRPMESDELALYELLKSSKMCRSSNWECIRMYYFQEYGLNLPRIEHMPSIFTIERKIRTLKSEFKECRDEESDAIKQEQVEKFKEMALDKNKYERPKEVKYEEETIEGGFW